MKTQNLKKNAVLNTIKTVCGIIFPLITFPYVSRVLMPDNVGKINFGLSFVSYFSLVASLGINTYAIRECSAKKDNKDELSSLSSQIFSINICTSLIAYALMFITLLLFRRFDFYRPLILIQSTSILFTTLGCDWLNTAMEDFTFITVRTVAFQVISLILLFAFIRTPEDYLKYAVISVVSASGANIANVFYRRKYCKVAFTKNICWKQHLKPILLLFVMLLAQTIFNSSDITMLGLMKGEYEVGLYSSAVKMSNLISQVVTSLAWVVMPRMSMYFAQEDYIKINETLKKALNGLISIGLPCAIGCICLSKEIVLIISGNLYLEATPALIILMIGFVFSLVGGSFLGNMVLLPAKQEKKYMIICCIATSVNLGLNYLLIPLWGVNAAAGTTALASLLILVLLVIMKDKRIKIDGVCRLFLTPSLGCAWIVLSCWFVKCFCKNLAWRTIACIVLGGLGYLLIQIIFKNEIVIQMITTLKQKMKMK